MIPVLLAIGFAIACGVLLMELRSALRKRALARLDDGDPALEAALAELAASKPIDRQPRPAMKTLAELIPAVKWCAPGEAMTALSGLCDPQAAPLALTRLAASRPSVSRPSVSRPSVSRPSVSRPSVSRPGVPVEAERYAEAPPLPGDGADSTGERLAVDDAAESGERLANLYELPFAKRDKLLSVELGVAPAAPARDSEPMLSVEVDIDDLVDTCESQVLTAVEAEELLAQAEAFSEDERLIKEVLNELEDDPEPNTMQKLPKHPQAIDTADVLADAFVDDSDEPPLIDDEEFVDTEVISEKEMAEEIAMAVVSDPGFDMRETARKYQVMTPPAAGVVERARRDQSAATRDVTLSCRARARRCRPCASAEARWMC